MTGTAGHTTAVLAVSDAIAAGVLLDAHDADDGWTRPYYRDGSWQALQRLVFSGQVVAADQEDLRHAEPSSPSPP